MKKVNGPIGPTHWEIGFKVLSGQNQVQTIRTAEIYCCQVFFLNFNGTSSQVEHKTGFSAFKTGIILQIVLL